MEYIKGNRRVVEFSSDIFLAQSSLGKSLIYCVRNFYNLNNACYNFGGKISKPHADQLHDPTYYSLLCHYYITNFFYFILQNHYCITRYPSFKIF